MAKTYAEYVAESKARPPSIHLAPAGAVPKHTKGDYPKARVVNKIRLENGDFKVGEVPFQKDGVINRSKYNKIRWGGKRSSKLRSIK